MLEIIIMAQVIQWNHTEYEWLTIYYWIMDCIERWKFMWVISCFLCALQQSLNCYELNLLDILELFSAYEFTWNLNLTNLT